MRSAFRRALLGGFLLGVASLAVHAAPSFVGTAACATRHAKQAAAWQGSDHDLAMQKPDAKTVLGA